MNTAAQEAFDGCPNRRTSLEGNSYGMIDSSVLIVECPKYPNGEEFMAGRNFDNNVARGRAALKFGCVGCKYANAEVREIEADELMERFHPAIAEHCGKLYTDEYYPEAAIKGFKVVKDRLRDLTGYELATDAFGRGGLYIEGSTAEHVDINFQDGAKFVMMAIDRFRNEGSHTAYSNITGSQRALEYLSLSSLAMHLLDSAVIIKDE